MRITRSQLRKIIKEVGSPLPREPMTIDYVYNSLVNGKSAISGESFGDIAMDAVMDGDWWKAANAIEDALWIDDPPVGAEEELADLLFAADPHDHRDLAVVAAEWGTRHFRS
jgi:hypothetical protein